MNQYSIYIFQYNNFDFSTKSHNFRIYNKYHYLKITANKIGQAHKFDYNKKSDLTSPLILLQNLQTFKILTKSGAKIYWTFGCVISLTEYPLLEVTE